MIKNLPAMQETWVISLGLEDPLEEGMETHSRVLAWRIPMDRGARRAAVHGVAKSRTRLCTVRNYFTVLSQFVLHNEGNRLHAYIYPLFWGFPSHLGHYRALSVAPCAVQ